MPSPRASLIALAILLLSLPACQQEPPPVAPVATPTPAPGASPEPSATPTPKPAQKPATGPVATPVPVTKPAQVLLQAPVRVRIVSEAGKLIGLRETEGPNRSAVIDAMNRLTGAAMGSPWCASFNAFVYDKAKVPKGWPKSAWSPYWVASPTWTRAKGGQTPKPGDSFGIYFSSKGRVAHTGLVESWGDSVVSLEGNTGPTGSVGAKDREGDGSYRKRRLPSQIHSTRNWIND